MRQRNHCGGLSHCKTNLLCRLHALEWDEIQKPTWVRQAWHGMICRPFRDFGMIIGESVCPPLARWLIICGPDGLWLLPRSRARKGAEKPDSNLEAGVCTTHSGASRTCGTRPTDSLRFHCEGLEEKFLERGAPAPLSVRSIDTTCASAKVWYSPSAYRSRP